MAEECPIPKPVAGCECGAYDGAVGKPMPKADRCGNRRRFLKANAAVLGAGLVGCSLPSPITKENAARLTKEQRLSLLAALKREEPHYDPQERMIQAKVASVGYHTTLRSGQVHKTRESLTYAVGLLDAGGEERLQRAAQIIERVVALQDQNPESETYGIWSWYLEEPLDTMSPPDWNWADFCGVQLLEAWLDHRDRLPEALVREMRESIRHAARSIERRDVTPRYTNIAIMGTYVTLMAGEHFGLDDLLEYARERLRRVHKHIVEQGSFTEYNSPTYSTVVIAELARMAMRVRNRDDLRLIAEIDDLAWKHAATHFHPPTRQWAGPHSRSYRTDIRIYKKVLSVLQTACGGRAEIVTERPIPHDIGYVKLRFRCPERYIPYFTTLEAARETVETFDTRPPTPIRGTTYLHPQFTLGTVNQGSFWNQRRSILAYWGRPNRPTYLHARVLHDDYDYSSARSFTSQYQSVAVTGVVFATDGGDTHPGLDKVKNGTIRARDMRLRFEIGGSVGSVQIEERAAPTAHFRITDQAVTVLIAPFESRFNGQPVKWEIGGDAEKRWIDAVCYRGETRTLNFLEMQEAFVAFALQLCTAEDERTPGNAPVLKRREEDEHFGAEWDSPSPIRLGVSIPVSPMPRKELQNRCKMDGSPFATGTG